MQDIERIAAAAEVDQADVAFLADLDPAGVTRLADILEAAGPKRDQQLEDAVQSGLKMVPRMLRRPIAKIVLPGRR
jgi:hypothetical protein